MGVAEPWEGTSQAEGTVSAKAHRWALAWRVQGGHGGRDGMSSSGRRIIEHDDLGVGEGAPHIFGLE